MKFTKYFSILLIASILPSISSAQEAPRNIGKVAANYTLQPLDVIQLTIFMEPDLEQQIRVSQDGSVNLALIGKVKVSGMSINEANRQISELYNRDYLVNPQISLNLISYTERRAYVHGQVNSPGPVIIPPEETLTLSQVISAAGSMTRLASEKIRVTRTTQDGKKDVQVYDFSDILDDPEANDVIILDGDSIFVPESWI